MRNATVSTSTTEVSIHEDEPPLLREPEFAFDIIPQTHSLKLSQISISPTWKNWRWQMQNRIRRISQLKSIFPRIDNSRLTEAGAKFPMAITPY